MTDLQRVNNVMKDKHTVENAMTDMQTVNDMVVDTQTADAVNDNVDPDANYKDPASSRL